MKVVLVSWYTMILLKYDNWQHHQSNFTSTGHSISHTSKMLQTMHTRTRKTVAYASVYSIPKKTKQLDTIKAALQFIFSQCLLLYMLNILWCSSLHNTEQKYIGIKVYCTRSTWVTWYRIMSWPSEASVGSLPVYFSHVGFRALIIAHFIYNWNQGTPAQNS